MSFALTLDLRQGVYGKVNKPEKADIVKTIPSNWGLTSRMTTCWQVPMPGPVRVGLLGTGSLGTGEMRWGRWGVLSEPDGAMLDRDGGIGAQSPLLCSTAATRHNLFSIISAEREIGEMLLCSSSFSNKPCDCVCCQHIHSVCLCRAAKLYPAVLSPLSQTHFDFPTHSVHN